MGYRKVVEREVRRLIADPLGWFIAFIFPFIMCFLICIVFGKAVPENLPIGVLDADNSQISRLLVRNINTTPSCKVKYRPLNIAEGKQLLVEGKIYAFVVIPKNFQRDIYRLNQPNLVFYYNNQRFLIGNVISRDIKSLVQTMLVGLDAKMRIKHGIPKKLAIQQSNVINVIEHIRSNPYFNYQYFLSLVAFGHILQISMVFVSIWAIGTEFKRGKTKDWLKVANDSVIVAILGKFTPYFLLFTLLFALLYFIYFGLYNVPYAGNLIIGLFATLFFIIASLFLGVVFISINGNYRNCLSFGAFYVAMGFALAGITYPTMSMPLLAKIYSVTSPLNYWVQIMIDQSMRNIPFKYDLKLLFSLLVIIFITSPTLYRLKKLAFDEKRWFKI